MMESLPTLKRICQSSRNTCDTWYGKHVARCFSIYITRALIPYPISANMVTMVFFLTGIVAGSLFLMGIRWVNLIAVILLQFWYVLDHVDGEIARYRKQESKEGLFLDKLVHHVVHPYVFLCIGIGTQEWSGNCAGIVAGMALVAMAAMDQIKDALCQKENAAKLKNKSVSMQTDLFSTPKEVHADTCSVQPSVSIEVAFFDTLRSMLKKGFSLLHSICTYPTVMNVISVVVLADILCPSRGLWYVVTVYAWIGTLVWSMRLGWIMRKGLCND